MHLKKVTLFNFKNYKEGSYTFSEGLNCILGDNGVGKTNLLDAIYYLCLTKSAFQHSDHSVINDNEEICSIKGDFEDQNSSRNTVLLKVGRSMRKTVTCNDEEYEKYSDHVGKFTVILVHPHDVDYVRMGSEWRRRLFDGILSQTDRKYLEFLMKYNRIVKQRNQALKLMREKRQNDSSLLDTYDHQIFDVLPYIYGARKQFILDLVKDFEKMYRRISDGKEAVGIKYQPSCSTEDMSEVFNNSRSADLETGRTTKGLHKDEFAFYIDNRHLKNYGSQGQQKSFILSVKLSFLKFFEQKPMLLLDDVFDRLDSGRISRLMEWIEEEGLQTFITDARPERVDQLLKEMEITSNTLYI